MPHTFDTLLKICNEEKLLLDKKVRDWKGQADPGVVGLHMPLMTSAS
jgi:hypothetical protein